MAAGRLALTTPGAAATAQRLYFRLGLWRGEYVLDYTVGVPYAARLGRKGDAPALLEADLRRAAASCPGLAALDAFTMRTDARTRAASVALRGRALDGAPVTLDDFRVTL